jgi:hypothetical protein
VAWEVCAGGEKEKGDKVKDKDKAHREAVQSSLV